MRIWIIMLLFNSAISMAQTDSMVVENVDGTIQAYGVSFIRDISFYGVPTSLKEQELREVVLSSFMLRPNYPNPFNPSTRIEYEIPQSGEVEVNIFDIQGRLVRSLEKSQQRPGAHLIVWDGKSENGTTAASGVYFCQVRFNGDLLTRKLALIK